MGLRRKLNSKITGFHMSKSALGWIHGLKKNNLLMTRPKFMEDMKERFGASSFNDKLEELMRLQ